MTIKDAPFTRYAMPLFESEVASAYWQANMSVDEIAKRFNLRSGKAVHGVAGAAKLCGVVCNRCNQEITVGKRGDAVHLIKRHEDRGGRGRIICATCDREMRAERLKPKAHKAHKVPQADAYDAKREFYESWEWRTLRTQIIKEQGRQCLCCGAAPGMFDQAGQPVMIVVDHIKPLSKYWELRLEKSNLQVLCQECNQGKGNWDETDWRKRSQDEALASMAPANGRAA